MVRTNAQAHEKGAPRAGGQPRGAMQGGEPSGADSERARRAPQLSADSRTDVLAEQRKEARTAILNAPMYWTSEARAAELCQIAATVPEHHERLRRAMLTGEVTAPEAVAYLDTMQPHARLTAMRQAGLLIVGRWVAARTKAGGTRRLIAYHLADQGDA